MGIFNKNRDELEALRAENNKLKFEVEDLKLTIKTLKEMNKKQEPLISALQKRLEEKQRYIDKYHIEVIKDEDKWEKHQSIDKKNKSKNKANNKNMGVDK